MSDAAAELRPETPAEPQSATAPEAPAAEPTPYQRRKEREQAKRDRAARARAAREARAKVAAEPKAGEPEPAQEQPTRTDAQRVEDAAAFLSGVLFPIVSVLASLFGYHLGDLTDAEAQEDAAAWLPLARRYRWFDLTITWAGAPARLVRRVRAKATRKPPPPPKVVPIKPPEPAR